jgi:hypothetical protein
MCVEKRNKRIGPFTTLEILKNVLIFANSTDSKSPQNLY